MRINYCSMLDTMGKLEEFLDDNPELGAQFLMDILNQADIIFSGPFDDSKDEVFQLDYPDFHYHFIRQDSYIELRYKKSLGNIKGYIKFITKDFPTTYSVTANKTQRIYFSCDIGYDFWGDQRVWDDWARLGVLSLYWRDISEAVQTIRHYEYTRWFCSQILSRPFGEPENLLDWLEIIITYLMCYQTEPPEFTAWHRSPLSIIAIDRNIWTGPDYFDDITLYVNDDYNGDDIEITYLRVMLNGTSILKYDNENYPLILNKGQSLLLWGLVFLYRWYELCELNSACLGSPVVADVLTWDYAQAAAYHYGGWNKDEDNIWYPIPIPWCSEYACYVMSRPFPGSTAQPCQRWMVENDRDPRNIWVRDMWEYLDDQNIRISPYDNYTWEELAEAVLPGYYACWDYGDYEHSFFFLRWIGGQSPADNYCCASFHAIGGNQSDRITVQEFRITNTYRYDPNDPFCDGCDPNSWAYQIRWGEEEYRCNGFGRTWSR